MSIVLSEQVAFQVRGQCYPITTQLQESKDEEESDSEEGNIF
jgi:hypothetical protein